MAAEKEYWFPAKRYGWGWGPPVRWQGWLVLILWLVTFFAGISRMRSGMSLKHALFVAGMILLLIWVCYLKGEPARWRWGDRD